MSRTKEAIERGLDLYRELLGEDPALEAEFEASRAEFSREWAASGAAQADPAALLLERRHLEWFLLERPSPHLGGVPAEALQEAWLERADPGVRQLAMAFLQSLAGAFEVTSSEPERGVWVADLFALGEVPVEEPEAAPELQSGDLLVGRLFPVGDGVFRLSPAVTCFRNPRLLEAVRGDLERMRQGRRGVLRIQQLELEHLFFSAQGPTAALTPLDPERERERIHAELVAAGLGREEAREVIETVTEAPEGPRTVTEILNRLAFETDVDLERSRLALAELWALVRHGHTAAAPPAPAREAAVGDAQAALAEFDRGRAEGRDLEGLFRELARSLGVESPEDEEEEPPPPDFPGVVGAMVEEFLWDVGRERGEPAAERLSGLRRLSSYARDIGVFENFGRRDVIDFAGRWLLDSGELTGTEEARAVFDALAEFCRWCEERHAHPLWSECRPHIERLLQDVPRLLLARARARRVTDEYRAYRVEAAEGERIVLRDDEGQERSARAPEALRDLLRPGDVLHGDVDPSGELVLQSAYPAELEELLDGPR